MATKFIVTVMHNGSKWPLRGTVWAFSMDRAQQFDTREQAQAALEKARKFMTATMYRQAVIETIQTLPEFEKKLEAMLDPERRPHNENL